jgi:hypothetical protein
LRDRQAEAEEGVLMITADGWLDWAIRLEPATKKVNPGINGARGIFMHSAEGYASVLLDPNSIYGYNGQHSWHLTNIFDGRVYQHYPFTARTWHATAGNQEYVGVENEGDYPKEPTLTEAQIRSSTRFIKEISDWKGWVPSRTGNATQTLWEHGEVPWLGGSGTSCPSGRIPWDEILRRLQGGPAVTPDEELELADRRAAALVIDAINFAQGSNDDALYRPVSVAEANGMLLVEFWTKDRKRPPEPVPAIWVKKPQ